MTLDGWAGLNEMPLASLGLRGLGPKRLAALAAAGVASALDLLAHVPKEYRDFSNVSEIAKLQADQFAHVQGRILSIRAGKTHRKRLQVLEGLIDDGSGTLRVVWYGKNYLAKQIQKGTRWAMLGKTKREKSGLTMGNPKAYPLGQALDDQSIGVVYPQLGGLRSDYLARWIGELLNRPLPEPALPETLRSYFQLPAFVEALKRIHRPDALNEDGEPLELDRALQRLKVQEFFLFQANLRQMVLASQKRPYPRLKVVNEVLPEFIANLPFQPTGDQMAVMNEIRKNLEDGSRLLALVQGDVGSGKTLVALFAVYHFFKSGFQSAFMAPTNLLAEQHFQTANGLLAPLGVRVGLLSGDRSPSENRKILGDIQNGQVDIAVGTHSLFQDRVKFKNLGLVLIDEQHRFGVEQRAALLKKAEAPHYLAFSATPIPRSLALTLHGNYQVHQIREKPANRVPVRTILKRSSNRAEVIAFAKNRIAKGEAVFWVFPLIEGDKDRAEASAIAMHRQLSEKHFDGDGVGLVHGRMEKERIASVMKEFRQGKIRVLVATTVIEVGVDVPDASIIVIEGAHHFGLSQLHQLRGRVGRGASQAFCFLMIPEDAPVDSLTRMRLLESCEDGFRIAEADLESRGAGQLLGRAQSGTAKFLFGDPWQDRALMDRVRKIMREGKKGVQ